MSEKVFDSLHVKVGSMDDTFINNPPSVAGQFSASKAYAAGDYVYYNRKLYRFTAAHAAGAWTGSDASEATVSGELSALKAELTQKDIRAILMLGYKLDSDGTVSTSASYNLAVFPISPNITYTVERTDSNLVYGFFNSFPQTGSIAEDGRHVDPSTATTINTDQDYVYVAVRYEVGSDFHAYTLSDYANSLIGIVTPEDYGAVGDGVTNDTLAIQKAFTVGTIILMQGDYLINANALTLYDNKTVIGDNAKLICVTSVVSEYKMLSIKGSNVCVSGLELVGDRETTEVTGEYGHGIYIYNGCKNVSVYDCSISQVHGDGIVSHAERGYFSNIKIYKAYRNGITIANGPFVIDGLFATNIDGTAPKMAIDIEPDVERNISGCISNVISQNNGGAVDIQGQGQTATLWNIVLNNIISQNDGVQGSNVYSPISIRSGATTGYVKVILSNVSIIDPYTNPVLIRNRGGNNYQISGDISIIRNAVTSGYDYLIWFDDNAYSPVVDLLLRCDNLTGINTRYFRRSNDGVLDRCYINLVGAFVYNNSHTTGDLHVRIKENNGGSLFFHYTAATDVIEPVKTLAAQINSSGEITASASSYDLYIYQISHNTKYDVVYTDSNLVYAYFDEEPDIGAVGIDGRHVDAAGSDSFTTGDIGSYIAIRTEKGTSVTLYNGSSFLGSYGLSIRRTAVGSYELSLPNSFRTYSATIASITPVASRQADDVRVSTWRSGDYIVVKTYVDDVLTNISFSGEIVNRAISNARKESVIDMLL